MSIADIPRKTMTAEEIMALSDDGIEREVVRGELRERPTTFHSTSHSGIQATVLTCLVSWAYARPRPRGKIYSMPGFRLSRCPETFVGIDVAFVSAEMIAMTEPKADFHDGGPALAVEILEPWDRYGDVVEKVRLFLEAGSVVWVVDPDFFSVRVHRPGRPVEDYNQTQELIGDPELPGFRVPVIEFFE